LSKKGDKRKGKREKGERKTEQLDGFFCFIFFPRQPRKKGEKKKEGGVFIFPPQGGTFVCRFGPPRKPPNHPSSQEIHLQHEGKRGRGKKFEKDEEGFSQRS